MTALGTILFESAGLRVLANLAGELPQQTQGYGGWEEIERPKRKSLTTWRGRQPISLSIPIMFDRLTEGDFGESVEPDVRNLQKMAGAGISGEPPVVTFDSGGVIEHDVTQENKWWLINGLEWGDYIRNPAGERVRVDVTVTLLEFVAGAVVVERSAAKKRSNKKQAQKPGAKDKQYVVKQGDNLISIAKKELKDPDRWPEIAALNKMRDPRNVKVGQQLRLP